MNIIQYGLILSFIFLFSGSIYSLSEREVKALHLQYPHLYVSVQSSASIAESFDFYINHHSASMMDSSIIAPSDKPKKWIVLIDDSMNYANRSSEGKRNHLLLELSNYFNENPDLLFSYLVSDHIVPFDMKRESILSLQSPITGSSRMIDAIVISNQQIRIKHQDVNPAILIIGSGKIHNNIEFDFLPLCPIFYFIPQYHFLDDKLFSFMVDSSGGSILTIPETINNTELFQKITTVPDKSFHYVAHLSIPLLSYRPYNALVINSKDDAMQIFFAAPAIYLGIALILAILFIVGVIFFLLKWIKNNTKKKNERKNQQEFSTAFLKIGLHDQRFEVRISSCEFLVGNSKNCDCILDDFELSATHCMIKEKNGFHNIIDLGSRNGVYVNGKKVKQCILQHEDMVVIGNTCMIYQQGPISYVSKNKIL